MSNFNQKCEIKQVPKPTPKAKELLVKMKACGCCHTDLHTVMGDWHVQPKMPLCPGHEGAGIVEAVGAGCENFKVGDRVGIAMLHSACGNCEHCMSGWETLCRSQQITGYSVDGTCAEYVIAKDSHAMKLPDHIDFEACAPILCTGVTCYKGIKETETKPGQFITILGAAGGLGHLCIQYAKAMGLRVIALDVGAKLDYCRSLGAELAVDMNLPQHEVARQVNEYTQGGCHGVVCCVTNAQSCQTGMLCCRRKGTLVCLGLQAGTFTCSMSDMIHKCLTVRGSMAGTRQDMAEALDFVHRGLVKCNVHCEPLEKVNEVFDRLQHNKVDGCVVFRV